MTRFDMLGSERKGKGKEGGLGEGRKKGTVRCCGLDLVRVLKLQAKATVIFAWAPRDLFAANTNSRVGYSSAAIGLFQTRFVQIQIGSARNHNTPPNLKQNQKRELVWFVWFVWFVRDAKWNGRHGRNDNSSCLPVGLVGCDTTFSTACCWLTSHLAWPKQVLVSAERSKRERGD